MNGQTSPLDDDRLLRIDEVAELTGIARATLYQMMARSEFPRPIKIGPRFVRWPLRELREFFAGCERFESASKSDLARL